MYTPKFLFGAMAWSHGHYQEAKDNYMDIETRLALLGEKNIRSAAIGHLGSLALEEGNFGQAHILLEESLGTAREVQNHFFIALRLIEIGNLYYLEGNTDEFKKKYQEGLSLTKKLNLLDKSNCLFFALRPLEGWPAHQTASVLGGLRHFQREADVPFDPILKRFYDRAEAHARQVLSREEFETAFTEGQTLSLDQAIELVLKMVEEM